MKNVQVRRSLGSYDNHFVCPHFLVRDNSKSFLPRNFILHTQEDHDTFKSLDQKVKIRKTFLSIFR